MPRRCCGGRPAARAAGGRLEKFIYNDAIVRAFARGVRPGSIVSLHLGHPGTLAAMPRLLATLADRRLAGVTTTRLLEPA